LLADALPQRLGALNRSGTFRRLVALAPGSLADLVGAIPAGLGLIIEAMLASPTTTRTPEPSKRGPDPVRHDERASFPLAYS